MKCMKKIKAGIIVFLGTNCEFDTMRACEFMGWDSEFIWQDEIIKKHYDVIFLPGGFSYGDHISSGRIAKTSNAVRSLAFGKSLIVGICNGFQILCEAKFLPGALVDNQNLKFISKVVDLNFNNQDISLPIAHHQGNYISNDLSAIDVIMRYKNCENGSDDNIAGIFDEKNKIMGMMPHPERAIFSQTGLIDGRKVFDFVAKRI